MNHKNVIKNGLEEQLSVLMSDLQKENKMETKFIGSYIADVLKQLKPPHLEGYDYAYPRFERTLKKQTAPVMQFKVVKDINIISQAVYGIKVPSSFLETVYPSVVLVPLMCFHPTKLHRIGYGGGYYDRYIEHTRLEKRNTLYVGVGAEKLKT